MPLLDNTDQYNIFCLEYAFDFQSDSTRNAITLYELVKNTLHLSYLKHPSLRLEKYPNITYGSNPRKTRGRATRTYYKRNCNNVVRIEFVVKNT